jgi:Fic family protein
MAKKTIARFNAFVKKNPLVHSLTHLLTLREAIDSLSSQHIRCQFEEILLDELMESTSNARKPIFDYLIALESAFRSFGHKPLDHTFFYHAYAAIKGRSSDKGRYRSRQNWIGPEGESKEKAYFFPPPPAVVPAAMSRLIAYGNKKEEEPLLQLAILFAQLLIIHPFMDGNGRIARLLIAFFLYQRKIVSEPIMFLSRFLKEQRLAYFQNLFSITFENRWDKWIHFFLKALSAQGKQDLLLLRKINALYQKLDKKLAKEWPRKKVERILLYLFQHPLTLQTFWEEREVLPLLKLNILKKVHRKKTALFAFTALLELFQAKKNPENRSRRLRGR